jgi:WhiB family transcriptional regulator, redox-sensing transcriptional regulator
MSGVSHVPNVRRMYRDHVRHSTAAMPDRATDEPRTLPCRVFDPDLWFAEKPAEIDEAKRLCAGCPIRFECLAGALARHEPWGVWGGEIVVGGVVVPYKPARGRPRKMQPCPAAIVA